MGRVRGGAQGWCLSETCHKLAPGMSCRFCFDGGIEEKSPVQEAVAGQGSKPGL